MNLQQNVRHENWQREAKQSHEFLKLYLLTLISWVKHAQVFGDEYAEQ